MITVENEVKIYELDGDEADPQIDKLMVGNHWNRTDFVVLAFGGRTFTVAANDLLCAVANSRNTGK